MKRFTTFCEFFTPIRRILCTPSILTLIIIFYAHTGYSQKGKNGGGGNSSTEIETVLECVKYIGNDTYVATFGYNNPNKKDFVVDEGNSVVIYNYGQSKKNAINIFSNGYHSKAFKQVFKGKDRCVWRVELPNGTVKETSASANSSHCRVEEDSDIRALFSGENEGGVLWPELYWLTLQENVESNEIFQIDNTSVGNESVLVEIVAFETTDLVQLRQSLINQYGFTYEIPNGNNPLVLTGFFLIDNLQAFNEEPLSSLVNFVRPIITPGLNGEWTYSGLVGTQQDLAMRSNLVRDGFNVDGTGTTICVISDNVGDITAGVGSGDLPPAAQLEVLADLSSFGPFTGSREGAAMIELIYDIAPGADYKFWTGTASPGFMAYGLTQFVDEGCDIAVDDVTHLFEPFLPTGQIAQAAEYAANAGVHVLSSTGNYGDRGFRGTFSNASIPQNFGDFAGTTENAHDFGGSIMQKVTLSPGIYILEMQWEGEFWAQGQTPGSQYDLNFWIVDDGGNFRYFGNRDNDGDEFDPTGEDPIEILGFEVLNETSLNIMITGANVPNGLPFQYIVFKAPKNGWQFADPGTAFNATTVVGHAASEAVTSVGAAFYGYTPEFENLPEMMEPFSSNGGLNLLGNQLLKPDITAPDGGNTSFFGELITYDNDDFRNFFGTSASAPAVAASMALSLELIDRIYDFSDGPIKSEQSPEALRTLLQSTSLDIESSGFDLKSGSGLIQLDQTALSLANPSPQVLDIIVEEGKTPGLEPFTLTLVLQYPVVDENGTPIIGQGGTEIKFREEVLPFTEDNWDWAVNGENEYIINYFVDIGIFIGNPPITVSNPPKAEVENPIDGGSVIINLLDIPKKDLFVKAGNTTKLFGESLPTEEYTYKVYEVNPTNPDPSTWLEYDLPAIEKAVLDAVITYSSEFSDTNGDIQLVDFLTGTGPYPIKLVTPDPFPVGLSEIYNFIGFGDDNRGFGALFIDPLPVVVTPDDKTIEYGSKLDITLTYDFMTPNIPDSAAVAEYIIQSHQELLAPDYFAIANKGLALVDKGLALVDKGLALVDKGLALVDGSAWMLTQDVIENKGLALVDGANNVYDIGIDVSSQFILEDPTVSFLENKGLALVDGQTLYGAGPAGVPYIEDKGLALVDKGLALVDKGLALVDEDGNPVEKEFKLFFIVSDNDDEVNEIKSVHFVTGLDVLPAGYNHYIAPGALLDPNLVVTNKLGELHILPRSISVAIDETNEANLGKDYGAEDPTFTYDVVEGALVSGDALTGELIREEGEDVGTYPFTLGSVKAGNPNDPSDHEYFGLNYNISLAGDPEFSISTATLSISAENKTKDYGQADPVLTYIFSGLAPGDDPSVITGTLVRTGDENVGTFDILQGDLSAGTNYTIVFNSGIFSITPAQLDLIVDDAFIYAGDPLPEFTYSIIGLINDTEFDVFESDATFRVDGPYSNAGIYIINPEPRLLKIPQNYIVNYQSGMLYVNENFNNARKIKVFCDCISETPDDPDGYSYVAHFYYDNPNDFTIHILAGLENYIDAEGNYDAIIPETFLPGIGQFDVRFDGTKIVWNLVSYQTNNKTSSTTNASSNTKKCNLESSGARLAEGTSERVIENSVDFDNIVGYPNPTSDYLFVEMNRDMLANAAIHFIDMNGKIMEIQMNRNISKNRMELDLASVEAGMYILKFDYFDTTRILKVIKQ